MKRAEVIAKINEYIPIKEKLIFEKSIDTNGLTFANVRDRLFGLGTILEESFGDCYYVVNVPAGVANKNAAVVLVLWSEETLSLFAYAKEGLIHQNTAENAIKKVIERIT